VKAAKAAAEPLRLEPVENGSEMMMLPEDREAFAAWQPEREAQYALVSNLDSLFLLRRNLKTLIDPKDASRQVAGEKGMAAAGSLTDLPSPAIVDRGRVVGLWEYDPGTESIACTSFVKKDRGMQDAVKKTEDYIRTQLGDARAFSLDSPKSRQPRIAALRQG
jgi:hypothetical protein